MTHGPAPGRVVFLGVGAGVVTLLLEAGEARLGLAGVTGLAGLVPIALSLVFGGPIGAGVAVLVSVGGVTAVLGGAGGVVSALRHVVPGLVLGAVLVRRARLVQSLLLVGAASLIGLMLVVWAYLPASTTLLGLLHRQAEAHSAELEQFAGRLGLGNDPGMLAQTARLMTTTMEVAGPAILLLGLLLSTLTNYVGARVVLRGGGFEPFAGEAVPDQLVWGVITGGILLLSQHDRAAVVGLNLLIVLGALYAIQGLAVLRHFFQKARVPRPLQGVSFALFVLQPILLVGAACLGLSDLWADFRKIRQAPTPA